MSQHSAYIGLGSNLNNPLAQLKRACAALNQLKDTQLIAASSVYLSKPMGPQDQPDFLNAVAKLVTHLPPETLLASLQEIEHQQRRQRTRHWGPRTLDLDILIYGAINLETPNLTIPHPGLLHRSFVLAPLREIAPTLILANGSSAADALSELQAEALTIVATPEQLLSACS